MEDHRWSRRRKFGFILIRVVFAVALGLVVMLLWNWLMPALFGLSVINYWQALGLLILSKILFGGGWFKSRYYGPRSWHWRRRFMKKWESMSEEDRNKMKEQFKSHCC